MCSIVQYMVLHDVTDRAHFFIETPAALDAELLCHGDLYAFDMFAVPDRLEKRIRETEIEQILNRFLAKVMVDAINRRLV